MVLVEKKDRETVSSLLRRFTRRVQKAGILIEARKRRFRIEPLSTFKKKQKALRRIRLSAYYKELVKKGIIEKGQPIPQQLKRRVLR